MRISKRVAIPLAAVAFICLSVNLHAKNTSSGSSNSVRGYTKKDGTFVAPHQRTNPNGTQRDNWSSKPNTNPYTGKDGKKEPQK